MVPKFSIKKAGDKIHARKEHGKGRKKKGANRCNRGGDGVKLSVGGEGIGEPLSLRCSATLGK